MVLLQKYHAPGFDRIADSQAIQVQTGTEEHAPFISSIPGDFVSIRAEVKTISALCQVGCDIIAAELSGKKRELMLSKWAAMGNRVTAIHTRTDRETLSLFRSGSRSRSIDPKTQCDESSPGIWIESAGFLVNLVLDASNDVVEFLIFLDFVVGNLDFEFILDCEEKIDHVR